MDRYQLVKLVQWAEECSDEGLESRKRMQKVVFLLRCAGCPMDADYLLHFYGPYSADVAQLTDELVRAGLLVEQASQNESRKQFSYKLSAGVGRSLISFEQTSEGRQALSRLAEFEAAAKQLLQSDLSRLEYAATFAYFRQKSADRNAALERTCECNRIQPDSGAALSAVELAERFLK